MVCCSTLSVQQRVQRLFTRRQAFLGGGGGVHSYTALPAAALCHLKQPCSIGRVSAPESTLYSTQGRLWPPEPPRWAGWKGRGAAAHCQVRLLCFQEGRSRVHEPSWLRAAMVVIHSKLVSTTFLVCGDECMRFVVASPYSMLPPLHALLLQHMLLHVEASKLLNKARAAAKAAVCHHCWCRLRAVVKWHDDECCFVA